MLTSHSQLLSGGPHRLLEVWTPPQLRDLSKILTSVVTGLKHSKIIVVIETQVKETPRNQREITSPNLHPHLKRSIVSKLLYGGMDKWSTTGLWVHDTCNTYTVHVCTVFFVPIMVFLAAREYLIKSRNMSCNFLVGHFIICRISILL